MMLSGSGCCLFGYPGVFNGGYGAGYPPTYGGGGYGGGACPNGACPGAYGGGYPGAYNAGAPTAVVPYGYPQTTYVNPLPVY